MKIITKKHSTQTMCEIVKKNKCLIRQMFGLAVSNNHLNDERIFELEHSIQNEIQIATSIMYNFDTFNIK